MRRREAIAVLGGHECAAVCGTRRRRARAPRRMGCSHCRKTIPRGRPASRAFREGLAASGWTEGRNLHIEYRWGSDRCRTSARLRRGSWCGENPTPSWPAAARRWLLCCRRRALCRSCSWRPQATSSRALSRTWRDPGGNATGFTRWGTFSLARQIAGNSEGDGGAKGSRVSSLMMQRGHATLTAYARALEPDTRRMGTDLILMPVGQRGRDRARDRDRGAGAERQPAPAARPIPSPNIAT